MSTIRILAVEDDPIYAQTIRLTVEQAGYQIIDVIANGEEALVEIERTRPDLLLLDIKIAGRYNGLELAEKINDDIPIIFITSLRERAIFEKAKEVQPIAFLVKPFDMLMLSNTMELAISAMAGEQKDVWNDQDIVLKDSFFIKEKRALIKVSIKDALFIMVEDKYCVLHTHKRKYVIRISMNKLQDKLPSYFVRVHRSYIVDISRINKIILEDYMLYIEDHPVPIGMSYKDELFSKLEKL